MCGLNSVSPDDTEVLTPCVSSLSVVVKHTWHNRLMKRGLFWLLVSDLLAHAQLTVLLCGLWQGSAADRECAWSPAAHQKWIRVCKRSFQAHPNNLKPHTRGHFLKASPPPQSTLNWGAKPLTGGPFGKHSKSKHLVPRTW